MNIIAIDVGSYMLDGGAIFGVVPKSLWSKVYPADETNLCRLQLRCLLLVTGNRRILIDTGIGNKQDEKFYAHYFRTGTDKLVQSLKEAGYLAEMITDVIFTHLHFDHCGGAFRKEANGTTMDIFPRATYWVSRQQWELSLMPNAREKASFLKENIQPLADSGKLQLVEKQGEFLPGIDLQFFNGHTAGQMIPFIRTGGRTMVYVADLLPFSAHIPLAWVCGFDTHPLVSMSEKEIFLREALEGNYCLFFEHDHFVECCDLQVTEKGIRMKNSFSLADWKEGVVPA